MFLPEEEGLGLQMEFNLDLGEVITDHLRETFSLSSTKASVLVAMILTHPDACLIIFARNVDCSYFMLFYHILS